MALNQQKDEQEAGVGQAGRVDQHSGCLRALPLPRLAALFSQLCGLRSVPSL